MPSLTPPNWFHFVSVSNMFDDISDLDTLRRKDPVYEPSVIEAMLDYIDTPDKLKMYVAALEQYIKQWPLGKVTNKENAELQKHLYRLMQTRRKAKLHLAGMKTVVDQAKKEESLYKEAYDAVDAVLLEIMHEYDLLDGVLLDDGTYVRVTKNPGRYVPTVEPDPSNDEFAAIEPFVKVKYSWDITKIKTALSEGVITKTWLDEHGIEFVRDESLRDN